MQHSFPQVLNALYPLKEDMAEFQRLHMDDMEAEIDAIFGGRQA